MMRRLSDHNPKYNHKCTYKIEEGEVDITKGESNMEMGQREI
jgi:hypothetical protein